MSMTSEKVALSEFCPPGQTPGVPARPLWWHSCCGVTHSLVYLGCSSDDILLGRGDSVEGELRSFWADTAYELGALGLAETLLLLCFRLDLFK